MKLLSFGRNQFERCNTWHHTYSRMHQMQCEENKEDLYSKHDHLVWTDGEEEQYS